MSGTCPQCSCEVDASRNPLLFNLFPTSIDPTSSAGPWSGTLIDGDLFRVFSIIYSKSGKVSYRLLAESMRDVVKDVSRACSGDLSARLPNR